jgi:hypothetical protein
MNNTLSTSATYNLVSSIVVTTIAIIGNSAVVFILSKPIFQKEPLFRYLIFATVVDTVNIFQIWPNSFPEVFMINEIVLSCKLLYFLAGVVNTFSALNNVLVSIDTLVIVKYSRRFQFRKKYKNQMLIELIIFLVSCMISLPFIFYMILKDGLCSGLTFDISFYINLYYSTVSIILPVIIIVLVSTITFIHLKKTQKRINPKKFKKSKSLLKITLGLNSLFFISNFPPFVVGMIFNLSNNNMPDLIYNFLALLSYIYYSCDFFIYMVANRLFRDTCFSYFKCKNTVN